MSSDDNVETNFLAFELAEALFLAETVHVHIFLYCFDLKDIVWQEWLFLAEFKNSKPSSPR